MSVEDLERAYTRELSYRWRTDLSPAERVWIVVHDPLLTRRVMAQLTRFETATIEAGKLWRALDLTDTFGKWVAQHEYAAELVEDPTTLDRGVLEEYSTAVAARVASALETTDESTVLALVGLASVYPYLRVNHLLAAVESDIRGRLLVFFPGSHQAEGNNFRLLGVRDGFNYRARPITATEHR